MSKTLGHALEGLVKGLVAYLCTQRSTEEVQFVVQRRLPVALSMDTDIVVYRISNGELLPFSLCAVFHSMAKRNSDMKWKRSRQEYLESETLPYREPAVPLDRNYHTVLCVFGRGWKEALELDMKEQLRPTIYFADYLTVDEEQALFEAVESLYLSFNGDRTEQLAQSVLDAPLAVPYAARLLPLLEQAIWDFQKGEPTAVVQDEINRLGTGAVATRLPEAISSRYNHGLTLLALFPPDEQIALFDLIESDDIDPSALTDVQQEALIRAIFLGVVRLRRIGRDSRYRLVFYARQSYADLDIEYVLRRMNPSDAQNLIEQLKEYAIQYPQRYQGATSAMRVSNWRDLSSVALEVTDAMIAWLQDQERLLTLLDQLRREEVVSPLSEVWNGASAGLLAGWSFIVALLVGVTGNRGHTQRHTFSRITPPTETEARELILEFVDIDTNTLRNALELTRSWFLALLQRDWRQLAELPLPAAINIKTPSSWIQSQYNVMVSHATFSFAALVAYNELALQETSEDDIYGFPKKRSQSVSEVIPGHFGRVQFQMVTDANAMVIRTYEGKTITANNYGNKKKELLDKIGEFKRACTKAGLQGESVVVLDGDFTTENLAELGSAEGYDRIYSMDEFIPQRTYRGNLRPE